MIFVVKATVLFIGLYNVRNQIAEAFLRQMGGSKFDVRSAWVEADESNHALGQAMQEVGINVTENKTSNIAELNHSGASFDYVIIVGDSEKCPVFPRAKKRLYWNVEDLSFLQYSGDEKVRRLRNVRDHIRTKVENWLTEIK